MLASENARPRYHFKWQMELCSLLFDTVYQAGNFMGKWRFIRFSIVG